MFHNNNNNNDNNEMKYTTITFPSYFSASNLKNKNEKILQTTVFYNKKNYNSLNLFNNNSVISNNNKLIEIIKKEKKENKEKGLFSDSVALNVILNNNETPFSNILIRLDDNTKYSNQQILNYIRKNFQEKFEIVKEKFENTEFEKEEDKIEILEKLNNISSLISKIGNKNEIGKPFLITHLKDTVFGTQWCQVVFPFSGETSKSIKKIKKIIEKVFSDVDMEKKQTSSFLRTLQNNIFVVDKKTTYYTKSEEKIPATYSFKTENNNLNGTFYIKPIITHSFEVNNEKTNFDVLLGFFFLNIFSKTIKDTNQTLTITKISPLKEGVRLSKEERIKIEERIIKSKEDNLIKEISDIIKNTLETIQDETGITPSDIAKILFDEKYKNFSISKINTLSILKTISKEKKEKDEKIQKVYDIATIGMKKITETKNKYKQKIIEETFDNFSIEKIKKYLSSKIKNERTRSSKKSIGLTLKNLDFIFDSIKETLKEAGLENKRTFTQIKEILKRKRKIINKINKKNKRNKENTLLLWKFLTNFFELLLNKKTNILKNYIISLLKLNDSFSLKIVDPTPLVADIEKATIKKILGGNYNYKDVGNVLYNVFLQTSENFKTKLSKKGKKELIKKILEGKNYKKTGKRKYTIEEQRVLAENFNYLNNDNVIISVNNYVLLVNSLTKKIKELDDETGILVKAKERKLFERTLKNTLNDVNIKDIIKRIIKIQIIKRIIPRNTIEFLEEKGLTEELKNNYGKVSDMFFVSKNIGTKELEKFNNIIDKTYEIAIKSTVIRNYTNGKIENFAKATEEQKIKEILQILKEKEFLKEEVLKKIIIGKKEESILSSIFKFIFNFILGETYKIKKEKEEKENQKRQEQLTKIRSKTGQLNTKYSYLL